MLRYLLLISAAPLLLLGCKTSNPYQADGLPLPPAPAAAATHFDTSGYPAQASLKNYQYWCWHNQDLSQANTVYTQNTAQGVLAEQLEQYGLRAAPTASQCELKVQLSSQQNQRVRYDHYDHPYPTANLGYGYGGRHSHYDRYGYSGIGMNIPITPRAYTEYYQQLTLSFTDAQTGQSVWRGQSAVSSNQSAQASEKSLRDAISSMLNSYR